MSAYGMPPSDHPLAQAMYDIADALRYPTDHRGRVYDVRFLIPALSYHLAMAGAVIDPARAVRKPRKIPPGPGIIDDAVEWVSVDEPDTVADELDGATIADVERLSPHARAELIRRLGGNQPPPETDDLDDRIPWRVQTNIVFDEETA